MNAADRELLTALLDHDASGWLPEAHRDECEDDDCIGCPDPLAYGPRGYRCGCGKNAHSNLVPCLAEDGESRG